MKNKQRFYSTNVNEHQMFFKQLVNAICVGPYGEKDNCCICHGFRGN